MTTVPSTANSFGVMARNDGTTELHSDDHGNIIDIAVNAKKYLRGDGTTESASQLTAMATAASGKKLYIPPGTYAMPDGTPFLDLVTDTVVEGAGPQVTIITVKNAYAFTGTATGGGQVRNLTVSVRSGATTGGAWKVDSGTDIHLYRVLGASVSTCTDPVFYSKGGVGNHFDSCLGQGAAAPAYKLDATGATLAFNNANSLYKCLAKSTQGSTTAAVYLSGGGGNRIKDGTFESNRGYGVQLVSETSDIVEGVWFEDNSNHNVYINDGVSNQIVGNKIHYNHGDVGTADHINLTGSANGRHMNRIQGNIFVDASESGQAIRIGSGVEFTAILDNRGAGITGSTITDGGSYTMILGNDSGTSAGDIIQLPPGSTFRKLPNVKTNRTAAALGGDVNSAEAQFVVSDAAGTNYIVVGSRGYLVFRTGSTLTSSDELQTNSFVFYWDQAAGKIKARVRDNSGAYSTLDVTP